MVRLGARASLSIVCAIAACTIVCATAACAAGPGNGAAPAEGDVSASASSDLASGRTFAALSFEQASIEADMSLREGGALFPRVVNGSPAMPALVLPTPAFHGRAIAYSVPRGTEKERIEHKISTHEDPNAAHFGNVRYTSFAFMLDAAAPPMESSALFFQEWQGYPYGPPVALKLTKGNSGSLATLRLAIRNMETGPDSEQPDVVVWTGALRAGEWHKFVVMVQASHTDDGHLKLWFDGERVVDWYGRIGYDPAVVPGAYDGFDTKFGLYQPSPNAGHTVYFDDVRFASTFAAATSP